MRTAGSTFLPLLIVASAFMPLAPAIAFTQTFGSAQISEPAGLSVIENLMAQTNITVTIVGTPGDAVSLGVPGSVNLTSAGSPDLLLKTSTDPAMVYANGVILSQDTVSVSIGAEVDTQANGRPNSGRYDGVLVVLGQYN